jgi:phosphatidate cytidylyltransferase
MPDNSSVTGTERPKRLVISENLRQRIIWGAALALVAIGFAYYSLTTFALLVLVVALFLSWEWGHMVRGTSADLGYLIHATAVAVAVGLATSGYAAIGGAVLVTAAIILVPVVFGNGARLSALGVFYVGLPVIALLWLRADEPNGFFAVLLIFAIVWSSDIGAFAAGRLIGGPRLWPRVSPNKTWAGFLGAIAAGAVAAALVSLLIAGASPVRLALVGLVLSLVAQAGDLSESALKRLFGLKDASALIPGHGGFMDRMDSIVAAAVIAALYALAVDPQAPAHALLFGS